MRLLELTYHLLFATPLLSTRAPAAPKHIPSHAYVQVETDPSGITWPWRVFKSSPHSPPNMTIISNGRKLAPGFIFMTPQGISSSGKPAAEENGGFIMTTDNEMVYALNISGITDFRVQSFGPRFLTYWTGYNTNGANIGHGYGQVNFIDTSYKQHLTLDPNLGLTKLVKTQVANWSIDIHEHQLTLQNTMIVSAYNNTPYDLSSLGGPKNGWIVDAMVFELDIETGEVLFSWAARDHVPLSQSHQPIVTATSNATKESPWDWFHVNSVQKVDNDYLINGRHTWSTYYVSGADGSVTWRLQGQDGGDFGKLPADGTFRWQHLARAWNVTNTSLDLSIFDNHNSAVDQTKTASRGLVYHLKLPAKKSYQPQLVRRIETPSEEIFADSQGSYDPTLSNGNQLLGYGQIAETREYGPATDGSDLRWQAIFGGKNTVQSYRAFKDIWSATPAAWDPSLVVEDNVAYVSWNGATDVKQWNVYTNGGKTPKAVAVKKGFETVFNVPAGTTTVQVGAVQGSQEVRRSNVVTVS